MVSEAQDLRARPQHGGEAGPAGAVAITSTRRPSRPAAGEAQT
jgi:hypothetical protein